MQAAIPMKNRVRRTAGSRSMAQFVDRNGLTPVTVYLPEKLHAALEAIAAEADEDTSIQSLLTIALTRHYGVRGAADLPPLTAPTRTTKEPHANYTWYGDVELHKTIKLLAVELGSTCQQLIVSAIVATYSDHPRIKKLKIKTGYPAYARAPAVLPRLAAG